MKYDVLDLTINRLSCRIINLKFIKNTTKKDMHPNVSSINNVSFQVGGGGVSKKLTLANMGGGLKCPKLGWYY